MGFSPQTVLLGIAVFSPEDVSSEFEFVLQPSPGASNNNTLLLIINYCWDFEHSPGGKAAGVGEALVMLPCGSVMATERHARPRAWWDPVATSELKSW